MTQAIQTDASTADPSNLGLDDASDAFLARFTQQQGDADAAKPSADKGDTEEDPRKKRGEDTDEDTSDTTDDDADEAIDKGDEKKADKKYVDDDNETYVKIKVGDEEHEVPVSQLKKLHGQESALTKRSMELAEQRKRVESDATKHNAALNVLIQRAREKAAPYANLDFLTLSRDPTVTDEQLQAVRQEAQRAYDEVRFLEQELGNFTTVVQQQQHAQLVQQAQNTVKTLSDEASPHYIEGWNEKLYGDICNFAVNEGLDKDIVSNLVDAPAIKLLHMAMQYKNGHAKVQTTKVNNTVKKVVKTTQSTSSAMPTSNKAKADRAMGALKATGSLDAAEAAFLARWADD